MLELLYQKHYFGRDMFLLKYNDKVIKCYRSSGLSGTGHKGRILPYSRLNIKDTYACSGYIFKEMYYNNRWINHNKFPERFDNSGTIKNNLIVLGEFLNNKFPVFEEQMDNIDSILSIASVIESDMESLIKGMEYFDFTDRIILI